MTLKQHLIDIAEHTDAQSWPTMVRLAAPAASELNITHAVHTMRLWKRADDVMSLAFASHALDAACRRLRIAVSA